MSRFHTKPNGGKAEGAEFRLATAKGDIIIALDADTYSRPETVSALAHDLRRGASGPSQATQGGQPGQPRDTMAGARVRHQPEPRPPRLLPRSTASPSCPARSARGGGRWSRTRRLQRRHAGGGPGPHARRCGARVIDRAMRTSDRLYRGARHAPDARAAAFPLVVRHAAVRVEARARFLDPRYGSLGFIAMPNIWIFQLFFPLISPMTDLMFLWTLARGSDRVISNISRNLHTRQPT